ncbi:helix-turn-helix domain-containing protein [Ekhidna sp. To15]|uniref:helix-turn-helix domain-containing protein n=1 Tax=Ekhidna sp. To15 TaxID=3395267 RepID=UPI003F524D41
MPLFNTYQLVIFLGVINGAILLISLASLPRRFKRPTLFLGFFILGYTMYVANWTIFPSIAYYIDAPPLWIPSLYFLPALAYYFTQAITSAPERFIARNKIYFLPGILDAIYQSIKWIAALVRGSGYYFPLDNRVEFFIYEGIGIVFSTICLYNMYRLVKQMELKKNLTYNFYRFAFFYLVFVLFRWMALVIIDLIQPSLLSFELQFVFWAMDLACFFFLGYRNLVAPAKYNARLAVETSDKSQSNKLISVLESDKMYLNPDLGRRDLALRLEITEEKVSAILNDELDITFYSLVNQMRVDESKELLDNGAAETLTMEAIAGQSGFKSKTTFYKFFKTKVGMNPKEYLKSRNTTIQ